MMEVGIHTMPQMFAVFIAVAGPLMGISMAGGWLGRKVRMATIALEVS